MINSQGTINPSSPWTPVDQCHCMEVSVIILGLVLLVLGIILNVSILYILGIILLIVGVVLFILGSTGRAVGGRRHWF
jgi:hypothetical protein